MRVSKVALARCGCRTTLSSAISASGTFGSSAKTSSPAPPSRPSTRADTRAGSSTTLPRAILTRMPSGPRALSTSLPIAPRDCAPPAADTTKKSTFAARGDLASNTPHSKDAEPLTAHLRAEREGFSPRLRSRANETVTNAEAARCRQQQCQTKVRHIVSEDVRRRRDSDAPSFCLSEVYRVGPDTVDGDDFERRQSIHDRRSHATTAACRNAADSGTDISQKTFRVFGFEQPVHGIGKIELRLDLGHHRLDQQHVGFHNVFLEFCAENYINR